MAQSKKPFAVSEANQAAYDALYSNEMGDILITGPKNSGKSTMGNDMAQRAKLVENGPQITFISAAEIYLALFVQENEVVLERVGMHDIVVIDDIEQLLDKEEGVEVFKLLIKARRGENKRTILMSNLSLEELEKFEGFSDLGYDSEFVMTPYTKETASGLVRELTAFYEKPNSPKLEEDVYQVLADFAFDEKDGVADIDILCQFVMQEREEDDKETFNAEDVKALLYA